MQPLELARSLSLENLETRQRCPTLTEEIRILLISENLVVDIFILVQLRMSPKSTVLELIAQDIRSNIGFGIII